MIPLIILVFLSFVTGQQMQPKGPTRIVGGADAEINQYPYQVSLQAYGSHFCGASIISETWILTACHCVESIRKPDHLSIRVGSTYHNTGGQTYSINTIIKHPKYSENCFDYDIALLETKNPIILNDAKIIELPPEGTGPPENSMATITGWGALSSGGKISRNLQMVQIPILSQSDCRTAVKALDHDITDRMICAGISAGGKDSCQGDSGGPLVVDGLLYGAVSWGIGCAFPQSPGIYTNIAALRSWIDEKTCV